MKHDFFYVLPFCSLLIGGLALPSLAIEAHDLIVRNSLGQPIHFEVSENVQSPEAEAYTIQPRWEVQLKKVKVDLSNPEALRVRLNESESKTVFCQTIFTTFSANPKVAVIISQTDQALRCDTVDLNGAPSESTSSLQQSVVLSRLALRD